MNEVICYWDTMSQTLTGSILSKARKFNKEKCVVRQGTDLWYVNPIEGYNSTIYRVQRNRVNNIETWNCNCQFNSQTGKNCSHVMACALNEKMENYTEAIDVE